MLSGPGVAFLVSLIAERSSLMEKAWFRAGSIGVEWDIEFCNSRVWIGRCGSLEMAPHVNKWSPLDGAHKQRVAVIVTTGELS